jgi:hypothetical protein
MSRSQRLASLAFENYVTCSQQLDKRFPNTASKVGVMSRCHTRCCTRKCQLLQCQLMSRKYQLLSQLLLLVQGCRYTCLSFGNAFLLECARYESCDAKCSHLRTTNMSSHKRWDRPASCLTNWHSVLLATPWSVLTLGFVLWWHVLPPADEAVGSDGGTNISALQNLLRRGRSCCVPIFFFLTRPLSTSALHRIGTGL